MLFKIFFIDHRIEPEIQLFFRPLKGSLFGVYNIQHLLILFQSLEGDKKNPIFNETSDEDVIGIASQMFFPGLFGLENWTPNVSALWADGDNDIDFNDSSGWMISVGIFRNF